MSDNEQTFDEAWDAANAAAPKDKQQETIEHPPEPAAETKPAEAPAPAEAEPAQQEPEESDFKALYEKEAQRNKSWAGRIRKANQAAEEATAEIARLRAEIQQLRTTPVAPPTEAPAEPLNDEVLDKFVAEFPDLHQPLLALVRKEAKSLVAKEMGDIRPAMKQFRESEEQRSAREERETIELHFRTITAKHADFQQLVDDGTLQTWIESKPTLYQGPLQQVAKSGTAQEVIEMFDQLKADLEVTSPHPNPTGDKRDKLKGMVAVTGRSPGVPKKSTPASDYDSAWDEATRTK